MFSFKFSETFFLCSLTCWKEVSWADLEKRLEVLLQSWFIPCLQWIQLLYREQLGEFPKEICWRLRWRRVSKMIFHGFQQSLHHTWAIPMCVDTTGEGSHLGQGPCGVVTLLLNFRFNTWCSVACWFEQGLAVTLWPVHCCLCSLFPNVNEILLPHFILVMKMINALQCFVCSIRDQRDLLLCLSALRRHGFKIGSCF